MDWAAERFQAIAALYTSKGYTVEYRKNPAAYEFAGEAELENMRNKYQTWYGKSRYPSATPDQRHQYDDDNPRT